MSKTLVDIAHANNCNPLDNFFEENDPNLMNPPYVLGWVQEAQGQSGQSTSIDQQLQGSAVFWCKKTEKSEKPYKLIFAASDPVTREFKMADPKQLGGCPATLEYWNGPAGLRIETQRNLQVRDYYSAAEKGPGQRGPTVVLPRAQVLVSDNGDGLETMFLCYRGQWLVRMLD
jgi:hypothetical protein